ncbi:Thiamine-phosphate synthase [Thiomonas arsenitoxydans]|uniref:Thiamine-phosphate synthase n=1 Tax=Thiomonas arsenitoxydans (strain DSM 22701 / CIP 110005 / 3As) TaxID=426114 RepID=D6CLD3_THIA3|nr:thiamine phosphate synthase [Thiomonas arsenitoxydans]CQR45536.1 Thiamine-phosphate synthase [Thiomonas sp. CB3]CAZ89361.1 putative Thiamine-phosphate pyrophosphorylase (TMP pyrophosphorylase) (TMP-PPase) (Thiamine-phosphate synthase) (ThiE) [Thiomonas arsenitoxydans]CQR33836.1 Thiamine-phosphate synthase [Thiomonas arsenitoxydans]CQR35573.1 Thiamine-phosphate synthase [Thiomonas arsenitoxydans]CQR37805.1 Thiamine-phosphate synthase [Thiomonas arsenitoxydans]
MTDSARRWPLAALRLHLVTDAALCGPRGVEAVVAAAVRGGATCVQLREKQLDTRPFVERARALKALLAPLEVPLIINDRLDVALAAGADGVHVGQSDLPPEDVRRLMPHALIGLSVENPEQVRAAADMPVDYLGVSPVFSTPSKQDTAPALGLEGLRAMRAFTDLPLIAIGGIDLNNAAQVLAAGADGLAVVRALCAAPDPAAAAQALRQLTDSSTFVHS